MMKYLLWVVKVTQTHDDGNMFPLQLVEEGFLSLSLLVSVVIVQLVGHQYVVECPACRLFKQQHRRQV